MLTRHLEEKKGQAHEATWTRLDIQKSFMLCTLRGLKREGYSMLYGCLKCGAGNNQYVVNALMKTFELITFLVFRSEKYDHAIQV